MGPADQFFAGVIELARIIQANRPPRPRPPKPPPDPAGDALRGWCGRCLVGVERTAPPAPWRTVIPGVNGDRELCAGWEPGPGLVIRKGHGPVNPMESDWPGTEPEGCYCHATTMPPCAWCCP
jgi:hypothetical protein